MKKHLFKKKIIKTLLPISSVAFVSISFVSCSLEILPDPDPDLTIKVSFHADSEKQEQIVLGNPTEILKDSTRFDNINRPIVEKDGYIFSGWSFEDTRAGEPISPDFEISENVDVYPIWLETTDTANIWVVIDDIRYPCDINSICSLNEEQNIIVYELDGKTEKLSIKRDEFNLPVIIGKDITFLPDNFLAICSNFNKTITFDEGSQLHVIGESFMHGCEKFNNGASTSNAPFVLPENVHCIFNNFLGSCDEFNQELPLPEGLLAIGSDFLSFCYKFNQSMIFRKTLEYLGFNCMYGCDAFTQQITFDCPIVNVVFGQGYTLSSYDNPAAPICTEGFTVVGEERENFVNQFPTTNDPILGIYRTIKD